MFTIGVTSVIGIILALIADRRICKSKGGLKGRVYTTLAIITAVIVLARFVIPMIPVRHVRRVPCSINLTVLREAMLDYNSDFNSQYPVPDKWCDLIVRHSKVREIFFVCPKAGKGRCHYAINPYCEPTSPPDVVLLFETKCGWNQSGGPELLTLENHDGKGCNVSFNGGSIEFVRAERLGELKWVTEKKDSEPVE